MNLINLYNAKGEKHGLWMGYYDNGQLSYKGHYVNGREEGHWEWYRSNGQLFHKGHYVNGKQEGYWEEYYDNGQLKCKGHFVNGVFQEEKPEVILTMNEIAKKFGISVEQLKIKKV